MGAADSQADAEGLPGLTPEQQEQLSQLLDEYFNSLERGRPLTRQELTDRCPELAPLIGEYLSSLEFLQGAAVGFRPAESGDAEGRDPLVERQLGDFRIDRELGRGGMGVVYEAWQESLQRRVALKVLPFAALLDSKQITRFRHEAQAAAQLHHPHIVPVFAIGVERGVHYYAMQYIDGWPLDQVVARRRRPGRSAERSAAGGVRPDLPPGPFSLDIGDATYLRTMADVAAQAADGLQAAHEAGVVHRDVKPSNLLVTADGHVWITDFGLARCRGDLELTRPGDFVGTMRYMSPEQARGPTQFIDPRTDVYSLGATLYELLTLHPALRGDTAAELLRQLEVGHPYPPRAWNPAIPFDLETILLKALAKSRDERYSSARELAEDLRRFLSGRPIVARRPTLLDRSFKWARRHRIPVTLGVLLLAAVAAGLAVNSAIVTQQREVAERALRTARESFQQYRDQLALSQNHLGMLHEQRGDIEQAEKSYRESIRLQREALRENSRSHTARINLAATLSNLAVLQGSRNAADAETLFAECIEVQRELLAESPRDRSLAAALALTHSNRGSYRNRQGKTEEAVESYREAIRRLEPLHQDAPGDAAVARDLAVSRNNLGMALQRLDQLAESEEAFRKAVAVLPQGTAGGASQAADDSSRGGIFNNLGLVLQRQGRMADALTAFDEAIRCQEAACQAAPQVDRFRQLLSQHRANREKVYHSPDFPDRKQ
ncbi:MAG: protein kinase [Pirellulales bacterium]